MFKKYSSITNHYREEFIDPLLVHPQSQQRWFVKEKIHGSSVQVAVEEDDTTFIASRNRIIQPDDNFFGVQSVEDVIHVRKQLPEIKKYLGATTVNFYGELAGPGIQKGINYGDVKQYFLFDLMIDGRYVGFPILSAVSETFDLKYLKSLYSGSLEDCLKYSNEFDSTILGIPDNVCEGIVISPETPFYVGEHRAIIKSKNEKWTEKSRAKKTPKQKAVLTAEQLEFLDYINENRVNAVISKDPEVAKNFGKLTGLVIQDALKEYKVETSKLLNKEVGKIIKPFFLKNLRAD